jgi:hypothetical protein
MLNIIIITKFCKYYHDMHSRARMRHVLMMPSVVRRFRPAQLLTGFGFRV